MSAVRALTFDELMVPELQAFRLAFQMLDRIRTGEIESWRCFLCTGDYSGLPTVSVMAVIERSLGDPEKTMKPEELVAALRKLGDAAAAKGTRALDDWWDSLSGDDMARLTIKMDNLWKQTAANVDRQRGDP